MYRYEDERPKLFTVVGMNMFLGIRDRVNDILRTAGSVRMEEAISGFGGSSWERLACVDFMVEIGELREITNGDVAGQHRVFVAVSR